MNPETWKSLIEGAVRQISDRDYQQQTWFGSGQRISSPEELYCLLFDDLQFDRFLDENRSTLTDRQLAAASALKKRMEEYPLEDSPDPHNVIDNPGWVAVRSAAKDFLDALADSSNSLEPK